MVQDRQNVDEMNRLLIQDHLLTTSMGGPLPEQTDPNVFRRVLDVGCASGGWIIDAAHLYPATSFCGIDVSSRMIDYARTQAEAHQVSDRTEFRVMDALRMIEYPDASFDLVNVRLGVSFMRTWDWPKLLQELRRVTRPKGTIRLTDAEILHPSSSPAQQQVNAMILRTLFRAGHLFEEDTAGITAHLARLLGLHGWLNVQTKSYALPFQGGTVEGQHYQADWVHAMRTLRPFLAKWGCLSDDYDALCQQATEEIQRSDYHVHWNILTAWATKP